MTEKYRLLRAEKRLPEINLLVAPQGGKTKIFGIFGKKPFQFNLEDMGYDCYDPTHYGGVAYFNSAEFPNLLFREPQTQESISVMSNCVENIEEFQFVGDMVPLQLGRMVITSDGVFTNTYETNEQKLIELLKNAEKVNGIYLINGGMAFAPYESFKMGVQSGEDFVQGGLARALEHTLEKSADRLETIASEEFFPEGVNVSGFNDRRRNDSQRIVSFYPQDLRGIEYHNCFFEDPKLRLIVSCQHPNDSGYGYLFGVSTNEKVE